MRLQSWFLLRPLYLACRCFTSNCVLTLSSFCVCIQISLYKDTSCMELGLTLRLHFNLIAALTYLQIRIHSEVVRIRTSKYEFWQGGGNKVAHNTQITSGSTNFQSILFLNFIFFPSKCIGICIESVSQALSCMSIRSDLDTSYVTVFN